MAILRTAKIDAEIEKTKAKIIEFQSKLKELEHKRKDIENMEIVDIVRGLHIPLEQLAAMLQDIKGGGGTSGQIVPKSAPVKKDTENKEDETE